MTLRSFPRHSLPPVRKVLSRNLKRSKKARKNFRESKKIRFVAFKSLANQRRRSWWLLIGQLDFKRDASFCVLEALVVNVDSKLSNFV